MRNPLALARAGLAALGFALVLSACAALDLADTQTPRQALYAAEADYTAAVEGAAAFRRFCDDRPAADPCKPAVARLQTAQAGARTSLIAARTAVEGSGPGAGSETAVLAALQALREALVLFTDRLEETRP